MMALAKGLPDMLLMLPARWPLLLASAVKAERRKSAQHRARIFEKYFILQYVSA
jgi:hypothetical protein